MKSIYKALFEIENGDRRAVLCTVVSSAGSTPRKSGSKMIVFDDGSILGSIGGGNLEFAVCEKAAVILQTGLAVKEKFLLEKDLHMGCGGEVEVFIEPVENRKKLYIFGAGHIGRVLAEFAQKLDFRVVLIDERENIFSEFDASNYTVINKNHNDAFRELVFDENTFIASIAHTHGYDKEIVEFCAQQKFAYLGMIGSVRKVAKMKKAYLDSGTLNEEHFARIDWPMGIDISCQTPEEIAVSIIAKIVDVRGKQAQL